MLDLSCSTNYSTDFKIPDTGYTRIRELRRYLVTCRLSVNSEIKFIYNFHSLSILQVAQAIDLFHDHAEQAINKLEKDYRILASNKGYNPERFLNWKININTRPEKIYVK
jgi:hypothetical protein